MAWGIMRSTRLQKLAPSYHLLDRYTAVQSLAKLMSTDDNDDDGDDDDDDDDDDDNDDLAWQFL